jgi:mono/diheme cytochrome c family protein
MNTRFFNRLWLALIITTAAHSAAAVDLSSYNGEQLFNRFCASCHGVGAKGDGPVSSALATVPPDLTRIAKRHGGEFPTERVYQIIDGRLTRPPHGTREMPVWGWEFLRVDGDDPTAKARAEEVISRLVGYLRSVQK